MKKIISIIALVLVFALCVPVFAMASVSPVAPTTYKCDVISNNPNAGSVNKVDKGGNIYEISASPADGYKIVSWTITGDYKIVQGSTTDAVIIISANGDVSAVANFNAVDTDVDSKPSSPQTGDTVLYMIVLAGLMALAGAGFAFKKVRA